MFHGKDPAIKLFGRTIPLLRPPGAGGASVDSDPGIEDDAGERIEVESRGRAKSSSSEDQTEPGLPSPLTIKEDERETDKEDERETDKSSLKRPEKILPCPRCNSLDTKFCYYNNYNVNQPRHFCKNCQRYWTAGGTMRNVPIGAGRRRSKPSPPPPTQRELLPRGFPPWSLERETAEPPSPPPHPPRELLPGGFPPWSLERETEPPWFKGCSQERESPLTSANRVNQSSPNSPGSSSSLGKHSRENPNLLRREKISIFNKRHDSSGGSTIWVNPDAAEAIDKPRNSNF